MMANKLHITNTRDRKGDQLLEASTRMILVERRSRVRFPVELTVRYRSMGRRSTVLGMGRTLNMSSGGLLIACEHELRTGVRLELNIEWPSLLDGSIPLQLVATGKVVRSAGSGFAVAFASYQFRTMGRRLQSMEELAWDTPEPVLARSAGA